MKYLTYIYFNTVLLAFLVSLLSFYKKYPFHLKLFSILLGATFITELVATQIIKRNSWVYNSFTGIEFTVYALYFYKIIFISWLRKIIKGFILVFPLFWLVMVFFVTGFYKWNSYVIITGGCFTVCMALGYYYQLLYAKNDIHLSSSPEFWIATGMLVFYSCQTPYFGMMNFLIANYLPFARSFLKVILVIDTAMYLTFIYAFLCPLITHRKYP